MTRIAYTATAPNGTKHTISTTRRPYIGCIMALNAATGEERPSVWFCTALQEKRAMRRLRGNAAPTQFFVTVAAVAA